MWGPGMVGPSAQGQAGWGLEKEEWGWEGERAQQRPAEQGRNGTGCVLGEDAEWDSQESEEQRREFHRKNNLWACGQLL